MGEDISCCSIGTDKLSDAIGVGTSPTGDWESVCAIVALVTNRQHVTTAVAILIFISGLLNEKQTWD